MTATTLPSNFLSEATVRTFLRERPRRFESARLYLVGSIVTMVSIATIFGLLNLSALLRVHEANAAYTQSAAPVPSSTPSNSAPTHLAAVATPTPPVVPDIPNNTVSYPQLGISAPITWDVPFVESTVQKQLNNGVVHLTGTAHPGEHGNVVIFGHSSSYFWSRNPYKEIFAPLVTAQAGQEFTLSYKGVNYLYQITNVDEVTPDHVEIMNAGYFDSATLITCTPIGTATRRKVIRAKQISPYSDTNTAFSQANFSGTVPAGN